MSKYNFAPWEGAQRCTGSATTGARALLAVLLSEFQPPGRSGGIYNCRTVVGGSTTSTHGEGRAVDFMLPTSNGLPTEEGLKVGNQILGFLARNGRALGVQCIIWNRRIYSNVSPNGRAYTGQHPHYDHLHIELTRASGAALNITTIEHHTGLKVGAPKPEPTPAPPSTPAPSPALIREGEKGATVKHIQRRLNLHGARPPLVEDGDFGPLTKSRVIDFQRAKNIGVDGVVGPETMGELSKSPVAPSYRRMFVIASSLNVRSGPGTHYRRNRSIVRGTSVDVVSISNGWARLRTNEYVSAKYLSDSSSRQMTVTARSLHIRSGPGTNHPSIGGLRQNQRVTVKRIVSGWAEVEPRGWVSAQHLK